MMRTAPILVTIAGLLLALAMTLSAPPAKSQFVIACSDARPASAILA
ncbi:hypothetical protein FHS96_001624 [Sphingomonas zeicaulis]